MNCFAVLCAADACVRGALFVRFKCIQSAAEAAAATFTLLVVVPSRAEGSNVAPTIASANGADVLLLLDGADEASAKAANGATVLVKEPAGPTKAAALAWLATQHAALIERYDAVLLLDVGSTLAPSFLDDFRWPGDADALQATLEGGDGGAADSERFAQKFLDRGREAFGWNARLRGTGSALRARTFLELAPRLRTRVEDLEASLLLHRERIRMSAAVVFDEKPATVGMAGSQRARWLVGRYELLFRRAGTFAAHVAHRPLEGFAFIAEIFGQPLSLSVPLRLGVGAFAISRGRVVLGAAIAGSTLIDAALLAGRTSPRAALRLGASWLIAAALAPRALARWTRAGRS
jgi:hypothetical protein